jgi:hypothetical protein
MPHVVDQCCILPATALKYLSTSCVASGSCTYCTGAWSDCTTTCGYAGGWRYNTCGLAGWCNATAACCKETTPGVPYNLAPAGSTQIRKNVTTNLTWTGNDWKVGCPSNTNNYQVCAGSGCSYVNRGETASYSWTPTVAGASVPWSVKASNGSLTSADATANVCVEGGAVIGGYTPACGSQTRTCTENCGTDDCAGVVLTNCQHGAFTVSTSRHLEPQSSF